MPSYNDSLTVQDLIDLVAYLRSLKPTAEEHRGSCENMAKTDVAE